MSEQPVHSSICPKCGSQLPAGSHLCPACALAGVLEIASESDAIALLLHDIPQPGEKVKYIGDYELLEVIAHGGMGVVYKARQKSLNRIVALKMLIGGVHASAEFKRRFQQEAETVGSLQHPHIVPIYEVGEHDGQPYFAMEYVAGRDLARMTEVQLLPPRTAAQHLKTVAEAVHYAHQQGILHRDLKPSNILVGLDGRPRVTDFGLARQIGGDNLTVTGATVGTPGYLPPEQTSSVRGQVGVQSDVYSLGAVLYHLLSGRPPFLAGSAIETLQLVLNADPASLRQLNPSVPRDLETISLKCLAKRPTQRYVSAEELAKDLERWLDGRPISARPISVSERVVKWVRRRPAIAALLGALVFVGVFGALGILSQWRTAVTARHDAEQASRSTSNALLRLKLQLAENAAESGRYGVQLGHLAGVLRSQPTNRVAIERLLSTLGHRNYLLPTCPPLMHLAEVLDAEFSPDSSKLATGGADAQAMVFDAETGRILAGPMNHKGDVRMVRFSPNGRRLLSCSGENLARFWCIEPGLSEQQRLLSELGGHSAPVICALFDFQGTRAVTASFDGTAQIWDVTGQPRSLHRLTHRWAVIQAAFSPDGRELLTATADKTLHLWSVLNGLPASPDFEHPGQITYCGFSPDGQTMATICDASVFLWNVPAARTNVLQRAIVGHRSAVSYLAFSPDGNRLATATRSVRQNSAALWIWARDAGDWNLLAGPLPHDDDITAVDFSPDGLTLLTTSRDRRLRLWDGHTGELLTENSSHSDQVTNGKFSPDGRRIVSVSLDHDAVIWNVQRGGPLNLWFQQEGDVSAVDLHPNGRTMLAATSSGMLYLWDLANGQPLRDPFKHSAALQFARFTPDGKAVVTSAGDHCLRVWESETGKLLGASPPWEGSCRFGDLDPRGERVAVIIGETNVVLCVTRNGFTTHAKLPHTRKVEFVRFDTAGKCIVTSTDDGVGRIWDSTTGKLLVNQLVLPNSGFMFPRDRVINLANELARNATNLPDQNASGSNEAKVFSIPEWLSKSKDARGWVGMPLTNISVTNQEMTGYFNRLMSGAIASRMLDVAFSSDGRLMVTAHADGRAQIWDTKSWRAWKSSLAHAGPVRRARFSPDGSLVVTASDDLTARIWVTATGSEVCLPLRHRGPVQSADFSPDGSRILTTAQDNTLRVWDVATGLPLTDPLPQRGKIQMAMFSKAGRQVVSASDLYVRVWDVPIENGTVPRFFITLVEALAGGDSLAGGAEFRNATQLFDIATQRKLAPGTNFYGRFAGWMLSDAATNPVSFNASITRGTYFAHLLENNDLVSLEQAVKMAPTNATAIVRLASLLAAHNQDAHPRSASEAQALTRLADRLLKTESAKQETADQSKPKP